MRDNKQEISESLCKSQFAHVAAIVCRKMVLERDDRRLRAAQVGMLMRAYRESFAQADGRKGLTQEELLSRMADVDGQYGERYSHSTVSRWESGATRPTRQRLLAFGKALELSSVEVDGLITLAGLDGRDRSGALNQGSSTDPSDVGIADDSADALANFGAGSPQTGDRLIAASNLSDSIRFCLSRFLLPGICVAGGGYALASLGWTADWILTFFIAIVMGLVLTQGFLRMRKGDQLREFFFVSLFFLLSTPLLQMPLIRMDNYGFYTISDFAGTPIPCLMALMVNLGLALIAGLMFDFLWKWQYSNNGSEKRAPQRAAWVALLPLIFVYCCVMVISNVGSWLHLTVVMPVLGVVFITLLVLRDPMITPRERDLRFLLWAVVTAIIVLSALGGAAILTLYLAPSSLPQPDHNLLYSWDINFAALGYTKDELMERLHLGFIWVALSNFVYVVVVVGGNLIVAIYRRGNGNGAQPAVVISEFSDPGSHEEPPHSQQVKSLFIPRLLRNRPGNARAM